MTTSTSTVEKESLKRDCNILNFSFQLYNANSFSQKSQKQHFVMLSSLDNEQHKVNKNIFQNRPISSFQNFYKNEGPYFFSFFFCFNFILFNKIILYFFDIYCRLTFDSGGK